MKIGVRRLVVAVGSLALVTGGLSASATSAVAATPPYEPDPGSIGSITFFDASGQVVTSGAVNDVPFASYVLASHAGRAGDSKATLFGYLPKSGVPSGAWSGEALTASTNYPNASAPAPLTTSTLPLVSLTSGDSTLATLVADFPNTATDAYQGLYQIRVKTSGVGQPPDATYDSADILVSGSTWTQVYPGAAQATTTALAVTPASPVTQGAAVALNATVTPSAAAGTVQFQDGGSNLGSPVTVSAGIASLSTTALTVATHSLTATFTATDPTYLGSTSAAVSFVVDPLPTPPPPPADTTLTSHASHSSVTYGTGVTLSGVLRRLDGTPVPGAAIAVQSRALGATAWTALSTVGTSASGGWATAVRPGANRSYRAIYAGDAGDRASASATVTVTVRPKITLKLSKSKVRLATKVSFTGSVTPTHKGMRVSLQWLRHGKWVTKQTAKLSSTSKFSIVLKTFSRTDYFWRVVLSAHSDHVAGVSPSLKLKVM